VVFSLLHPRLNFTAYGSAMISLTFRAATADDVLALIRLVTSAHHGDASRAGS
jgi:hypothetical protein